MNIPTGQPIIGQAVAKYQGEDTIISVAFRNKTPIEYFATTEFGAGSANIDIDPAYIGRNDDEFDEFIDAAYKDANNIINVVKDDSVVYAKDLREEEIEKIRMCLDEIGGTIWDYEDALGIKFPIDRPSNTNSILDILFRIYGRENREVILGKEPHQYFIEIPKPCEYGIEVFFTEEEAIEFCEKYNLTIIT